MTRSIIDKMTILEAVLTVTMSFALCALITNAGSLTPSASPAASSFTLSDISTRLTTNASATVGNHVFSPTSTPTTSHSSFTELYGLIPTIDASKVLTGTTYFATAGTYNAANLAVGTVANSVTFGVSSTGTLYGDTDASKACSTATYAGTVTIATSTLAVGISACGTTGVLLGSMFNGSGSGFTGGSQANGGVRDDNNAAAPPTDRYWTPWTLCTSGNSYCGTGLASADAKDNVTGLIWSLPCNGSGCTSFSDSSPLTYTWDSSGANNSSKTASQLCSAGSHGESGWSLPHQKQQMQAYIDGEYGNLEAVGDSSKRYWSATTRSDSTTSAWDAIMAQGHIFFHTKNGSGGSFYVRCVK